MGAATMRREAADGQAIRMRWVLGRDLPAIESIEVDAVGPGASWSELDFRRALSSRDVVGLVAESPAGYVAGYILYRLGEEAIEILRIGVDPHRRGQGVSRAILDHLAGKLDRGRAAGRPRRTRLVAAAPDDRLDLHCWLRACGWRCEGIRSGPAGDVYWFSFAAPGAGPGR